MSVPLSEDEQRILHEIEQQFYATDPAFAREVGTTTLYRHAFRNLKLAGAGFMAGLARGKETNIWNYTGGKKESRKDQKKDLFLPFSFSSSTYCCCCYS